ncbi:penicillin-binding protein 1A [Legionella sp. W05-934-2]|uniref:penicillin-binding protein 1A n=1 Tax=Legionella sp. W05-934-2 TaxID=1198649 RepID=UPI003462495B
MKKIGYFWRTGLWALISLSFAILLMVIILYIYASSQLPDVESLKTVQLQVPLRIYTKDGLLIQEYGEKKRIPVDYKDIPQDLVHAVLATEDQRFFEHPGVDIMGLGRAAISVIQSGSKSQGGSTITMQVARNFFLSRKKTYFRKFNEILLAIKIDRELSKEKILELYFNKVYLGNRAYGVGAAAMVYYGKSLKELTLAQKAMIAGLPQAPSTQNPIANPLAAKKRRNHVLERLLEEGFITKEAYAEAINEPITAKYHGTTIDVEAPYVAEMIRNSLYQHFGPDAYTKGYKVYTTIDSKMQQAANQAVEDGLIAYDKRHGYRGPIANVGDVHEEKMDSVYTILKQYPIIQDLTPAVVVSVQNKQAKLLSRQSTNIQLNWSGMSWARPTLRHGWVGKSPQTANEILKVGDVVYVRKIGDEWELAQLPEIEGALIAMRPNDGAIQALVGGFNFQKSKFNRVTQMERQPGSSFKPFVYAAALNKGYTLATLVNDAPIVMQDPSQAGLWRPHNANRTFGGPTRLKQGLIRSRNLVSIRILNDIGIDYAIDFISKFGFDKNSLPYSLSLALGSLSVSPLQIATAYSVFANGGYLVDPYLIVKITDSDGNIILKANPEIACALDCDKRKTKAKQVIPNDLAFLMTTALRDVVQKGTARAAKTLKREDIAGKTGTTNEQVDTWFSGYTPDLVSTVWVGYDNPRSVHEYAAQLALPMWVDFMKRIMDKLPIRDLAPPANVVAIPIDENTGQLAKANQPHTIIEFFRENEKPNDDTGYTPVNDQFDQSDVEENLY